MTQSPPETESSLDLQRRRLRFRAWHRGTKEADLMIGGFADRHLEGMDADGLHWFERLLVEDDVDIMGWALGRQDVPPALQHPLVARLQALDYIGTAR